MCVPNMSAASSLVGGIVNTVSDYKTSKANYIYRTQIAQNNAISAQNEALRQKQLGIEKSRLEKISGLQEVSKLKAKNAASGFDLMSKTNELNYYDGLNLVSMNAQAIKAEYDAKSNNYLNQANYYLNQINEYTQQYNKSLFDNSFNALGKINKVTSDWYTNDGDKTYGIF